MFFDLEEELKKLPASPGVYLMHNHRDEIIYVGKAVSLKNRVRQYFQSSRNKTAKIQQMVSHIAWFEYILTDSELEEVMDEMYVDDTVDVLEEMPANVVDRLLMATDEETRVQINALLQYPEDSAGSVMNIDYAYRKDIGMLN